MKNIKWIILIAVAVSLLVSPCMGAEYLTDKKETLRGIRGMCVSIENLSDNVKELGLTRDILRMDVELKLRLAGIKVLSIKEERLKSLDLPYLYLNINTVIQSSGVSFSYHVELALKQTVLLLTTKNTSTFAETWTKSITGYAGDNVLIDALRSNTKDLVDMFLNDYLAVNPKQVDKPKKK